eukprot:TRINITY_DN8330_c0_g1_i1.p1 TRINITY_DN8330_c0_g1~~TRINITY_DN8330_c0_g1_i1.p1  ORF type:complete len:110 (+),score=17.27 TRINITY_DN8330_c0_g1_i1:471-800(+)
MKMIRSIPEQSTLTKISNGKKYPLKHRKCASSETIMYPNVKCDFWRVSMHLSKTKKQTFHFDNYQRVLSNKKRLHEKRQIIDSFKKGVDLRYFSTFTPLGKVQFPQKQL